MAELQRSRVLTAMTRAVCELGTANVSVADVVERAGVSRRTFYELFGSAQGCFLAALDEAFARARTRVLAAYDQASPWRARIRAALVALLAFFDEEQTLARLLVVESLGGGPAAIERRRRALAPLIDAVEAGRDQARAGASVPPLAAEGAVGGALAILHARLAADDGAPLTSLTNQLMCVLVLPYAGIAAARRELLPPLPEQMPQLPAPPRADPFKAANMRITYRTAMVMQTIALRPYSSNRQIADAAGIGDPGQASKLLARLERIGLIANASAEPVKGGANAWRVTAAGRQAVQAIRAGGGEPAAEEPSGVALAAAGATKATEGHDEA